MIITMIILLLLSLIVLYRPSLDQTRSGDVLLWYNDGNSRKYIKLW